MKVLQVIGSLKTGGAEKLIIDTLPLYNDKGIKMDLLLFWDDNKSPFLKSLKELNCCDITILKISSKNNIYSIYNIFKLKKYINNYDIIHVHLFPALYFVVFSKILNFSKIKIIFTEHSSNNRRLGKIFFNIIDSFIYSFYSKIICITPEVKEILKSKLKINNSKLNVIYNGVDLKKIQDSLPYQKVDFGYIENDVIIVMVAGLRREKDHITLLKALKVLPQKYRLILVGDGENKTLLNKEIKKLKIENRVDFLGVRNDVYSIIKMSDIIVLSSHYEGLSLSSIEGMASGKPFVASDVPGLREVVNGAGVLFEQGNAKQLAEIIKKLYEDKNYCETIVENCQKRVQKYSIEKMVNEHIFLFEKIHTNI